MFDPNKSFDENYPRVSAALLILGLLAIAVVVVLAFLIN